MDSKDQQKLREYLLGLFPSGELAPLEERLLTDAALYEELLITEDELIDQFLSAELSQSERENFETHFLVTPERQQKVRFARTLKKYVKAAHVAKPEETSSALDSADESVHSTRSNSRKTHIASSGVGKRRFFSFWPTNPLLGYSLTAALVLIVSASSWIALRSLRNPGTEGRGQVFPVSLRPGLTRDRGEIKKISIPSGTETLQLKLELPKADYPGYHAELLASEDGEVWVKENLRSEIADGKNLISFNVPAELIKRDDYRVKISGRRPDGNYEEIAGYVFRVTE